MGTIRSQLIYANPKMELVGIVDPAQTVNDNQLRSLASSLGTEAYSSLSDLVTTNDSTQIDGIVCCTPTHSHASVVREAMELDAAKGIFVEKPVDESASKIKALFEHVNKDASRNFQLCCGFQRRFDPSYRHLLDNIRSGAIGKPLNANVFFGDHPVPSLEFLKGGGDIFMDLSAHDVDFVLQIMGRKTDDDTVESVFASGTSSIPELEEIGVHDNATMTMKFQSGTSCIEDNLKQKIHYKPFPLTTCFAFNRSCSYNLYEPISILWIRPTV